MQRIGTRAMIFPVLAATLLTVGCVSQEDVQRAQTTANSAMAAAQQAGQAAQQAQQTADQARNDVAALNQKVDAMMQAHAARGPRD